MLFPAKESLDQKIVILCTFFEVWWHVCSFHVPPQNDLMLWRQSVQYYSISPRDRDFRALSPLPVSLTCICSTSLIISSRPTNKGTIIYSNSTLGYHYCHFTSVSHLQHQCTLAIESNSLSLKGVWILWSFGGIIFLHQCPVPNNEVMVCDV